MTALTYAISLFFVVLASCLAICVISALILFVFRAKRINDAMVHPLLAYGPFGRLPWTARIEIVLDYFFRMMWPRSRFWLVGQANVTLSHVDPGSVPSWVRRPIIAFWGSCMLGLFAAIVMWALVLAWLALR